jgi:Fanconi anemia group D2 protein
VLQYLIKRMNPGLDNQQILDESRWGHLSALEKKTVCHSLYYAINWIRELVCF